MTNRIEGPYYDSSGLTVGEGFSPKNLDKVIPGVSAEAFAQSFMGAVCDEKPELRGYLDEKNRLTVSGSYLSINGKGKMSWIPAFLIKEHGMNVYKMPGILTLPGGEPDETPLQVKVRELIQNSTPYIEMYGGNQGDEVVE